MFEKSSNGLTPTRRDAYVVDIAKTMHSNSEAVMRRLSCLQKRSASHAIPRRVRGVAATAYAATVANNTNDGKPIKRPLSKCDQARINGDPTRCVSKFYAVHPVSITLGQR